MVVEGDPTELSKHPKLEFLLVDCDLHNWEDLAKILAIPQLTIFSVDPPFCKMFEAKPESVLVSSLARDCEHVLVLKAIPVATNTYVTLMSLILLNCAMKVCNLGGIQAIRSLVGWLVS